MVMKKIFIDRQPTTYKALFMPMKYHDSRRTYILQHIDLH